MRVRDSFKRKENRKEKHTQGKRKAEGAEEVHSISISPDHKK